MKRYINEKIEAWREHGVRFDCAHEDTELRARTIKGGAVQYVYQCIKCGDSKNQPLAKAKALQLTGGEEPSPFDPTVKEDWEAARTTSSEGIKARFSRDAFFADYDEYLKTEKWALLRTKVFDRAEGKCEGCGEQPPSEVHHLTYEHVGREFLFQLVALCSQCHDRIHEEVEEE